MNLTNVLLIVGVLVAIVGFSRVSAWLERIDRVLGRFYDDLEPLADEARERERNRRL